MVAELPRALGVSMIMALTSRLHTGLGLWWMALSRVKAGSLSVNGMEPRSMKAVAVNSAVLTLAAHAGRAATPVVVVRSGEERPTESLSALVIAPVSTSCTLRHVPACGRREDEEDDAGEDEGCESAAARK